MRCREYWQLFIDWYHVQLFVWEKSVNMKMALTVDMRLQLSK